MNDLLPEIANFKTTDSPRLLILAAGFEQRSRAILRRASTLDSEILLIRYVSDIAENQKSYALIRKTLSDRHPNARLHQFDLSVAKKYRLPEDLLRALRALPMDGPGEIWVDTSGLPMFGICTVLWAVRQTYPYRVVRVFYTEAAKYYPTEDEYRSFERRNPRGELEMLKLGSMSAQMAENVILKPFAGAPDTGRSCLLLYAGYEKHRSFGVVEELNPQRLVFIYGIPGRRDLEWRLEMSKRLHETPLSERPTATEEVSTLNVGANLQVLREYYANLYDDHDLVVSPVCSKMQSVAAFLFWEEFRDIQLVFPLPVRYIPGRFSEGSGHTYELQLPEPPGLAALMAMAGSVSGS